MADKGLTQLIEMAIGREIEAYDFYMDIAGKLSEPTMKDTVLFIAGEEEKHRAFLENYLKEVAHPGTETFRMTEVTYYNIAEHETEPPVEEGMTRENVFLIAAHRELRSHNFYMALAGALPDGEPKQMLKKMANEELKHKEKMEYLYTNAAFPQTSGG
jgi:rubrerythrin